MEVGVKTKEPVILLLENEEIDVHLFHRALEKLGYHGDVRVLSCFAEGRDYVAGTGWFADRSRHPLPHLVVSDSALCDGKGVDFFHWLHAQPSAAEVPFVLFTSAEHPAVGVALVNAGARAFITKPILFADTQQCVKEILDFLPASFQPATTRPPRKQLSPR